MNPDRGRVRSGIFLWAMCEHPCDQRDQMYFVFCRLYLSSPSHYCHWQCLAPTCYACALNLTLYRGCGAAGLPIHMIGEVSWDPKGRRVLFVLVCYSFIHVTLTCNNVFKLSYIRFIDSQVKFSKYLILWASLLKHTRGLLSADTILVRFFSFLCLRTEYPLPLPMDRYR